MTARLSHSSARSSYSDRATRAGRGGGAGRPAEVGVQLPGAEQREHDRDGGERAADALMASASAAGLGRRRRQRRGGSPMRPKRVMPALRAPRAPARAAPRRRDRCGGAGGGGRRQLCHRAPRPRRHHDDAVGEYDGLLDVVRHEQHRARLARRARRASQRCMSARVIASSAPNGSSRQSTGLPASSVRTNATRWRIPPESCGGPRVLEAGEPEARRTAARARRAPARAERRGTRSARPALSSAAAHGSSRSRCGISTPPASAVARRRRVRRPAAPQTSSSSVDLPQPLGPTTATISPGAARSERRAPRSAVRPRQPRRPRPLGRPGSTPSSLVRRPSLPPRALPHRFEGSAPGRSSR